MYKIINENKEKKYYYITYIHDGNELFLLNESKNVMYIFESLETANDFRDFLQNQTDKVNFRTKEVAESDLIYLYYIVKSIFDNFLFVIVDKDDIFINRDLKELFNLEKGARWLS